MNLLLLIVVLCLIVNCPGTPAPIVPCPPVVQTKLGASVESIQRDGLLMSKDYVEFAKTHDLTDGGVE
jgi:hypothetical protein